MTEPVTYDIDQMAHDAQLAVNFVIELIERDPDAKIWVEQKVSMPMTTDAVWGTADIIAYLPQFDELWVIDYKYGRVEVMPENNPQLMIYMMCALQTLRPGAGMPAKMMVAIVQPRVGDPIKTWEVPPQHLFYEFLPKLKSSLVSINPNLLTKLVTESYHDERVPLQFVVSEDTCTFCPAMHCCEEAAKVAAEACGFAVRKDFTTTGDFLEEWLPMLSILRKWADAQEAIAVQLLQDGGAVAGYELGVGRTNKKWASETMTLEFLRSKGLPLKTIAPQKLLSPSQMYKVVKESTKKIALSDLDALSFKPEGKVKLQKAKNP